jgi:hypothetical protein
MTSQEIECQEARRAQYEVIVMMGQENRLFKHKLMALASDFEKAGEQNPFFYECALVLLQQWYGWEDVHHGEDFMDIDQMMRRLHKNIYSTS